MSIFTVFLKNRNFISKIRLSKVTDYAALTTFKPRLKIALHKASMLPYNYERNHYGRHNIALPKFVNHNEQAIGLKPGISWSQVEHSTTGAIGREGIIHEFGSFHIGNYLMLRQACKYYVKGHIKFFTAHIDMYIQNKPKSKTPHWLAKIALRYAQAFG